MFVLIWVTIFLSVRNISAVTGPSDWGQERCQQPGYCVTLNDAAVTAEAGLCAVIPCSFTSPFRPQNISWFKCKESNGQCKESERKCVFTSSMNRDVCPDFWGRVSLLEPDVHQKNCSILINDVTESDSGSYQLRVEGKERKDKFTFSVIKATLSVTGLKQKPRLTVPPLSEGQKTSLTCTAPGPCSGSPPKFTWTWTGKGEEDLGDTTKSHSEILTFTPSARHHGSNITCRISFTGDITAEETVTLNVTYIKKIKISGNPRVKEGEPLNLACSVRSFPPSFITWTKFTPDSNLQSDSLTDQRNESGKSSFLIPNVTVEDSGLYICTVTHLNNTSRKEIHVSVTYARKPQITGNPSVKEGEDLNLTCSVDSVPPSVISWTRSGNMNNLQSNHSIKQQNDSVIFQQDGISSFSVINITAGDAGLYICTAEHLNTTMTEGINVTVMYARKPQITGNKELKEGEDLNLTCSVDSVPPSVISWTRSGNMNNLQSNHSIKQQNDSVIFQQDGISSFSVINVTAGDAGLYICTAEHLNTTMTEGVNVTVMYTRKPQIIGETTVKEGDDLNLTCRAESFPPSVIKWTTHPGRGIYDQTDPGSATLFISNVTTEDSGLYICTAEHLDGNVTVSVSVTVTWFSKILTGSGCVLRSEVLTCVCLSEGFPLPSIQWPLLKDHTDYSVITTVSNHTVNSTVTIRHHGNSKVECFSSNQKGDAAENLSIHLIKPDVAKADQPQNHQVVILKVIAAFLCGGLLSAAIYCLALKYCRKKQKNAGNLDEAQEMTNVDPTIYSSPAVRSDWSKVQEAADCGAASSEEAVPGFKGVPKELVYASIDFSSWRPRAGAFRQNSSGTEYAQIKKRNKTEDDAVEVMTEEDKETNGIVQVEECSDEAVYSNVKDLSGEI